MKAIDAEEFSQICLDIEKDQKGQGNYANALFISEIRKMISTFPTVDAVPVKHGRWVMDEEPHDGDVRCSVCHIAIDQMHERNHGLLNALTGGKWHTFYHYCPHCGAKMDLEEDQSKCTSTDTRP